MDKKKIAGLAAAAALAGVGWLLKDAFADKEEEAKAVEIEERVGPCVVENTVHCPFLDNACVLPADCIP